MLENLSKLWTAVQENVVFLLACLLVFAGIFAVALLLEKLWLKPEKQSPARRVAYVGIFAAIAAVVMYFEFPLPFTPNFYELDFSEIPVLICSFSLGPVAGVVCEFLKVVLKLFFKGTSTAFVGDFLKYSTPVLVNDSLWGLGTTLITAVIGHMAISEEMLAAYAIMGNIEKFSTVACYGISGASAVIVGKRIGEGASREKVYEVSWCMLLLTVMIGLVVSLSLAVLLPTVFIPWLYPMFHLEGLSLEIAATMCVVFIIMMPTKAFDITNISGVLRAGGDVRVSAVIDVGSVWLVALPITVLSALVFEAPVALVCLGIQAEGLSKVPLGIWRLRSRKWINDVTREGAP